MAERVRAAAFAALEETGDLYDPDEKEVGEAAVEVDFDPVLNNETGGGA